MNIQPINLNTKNIKKLNTNTKIKDSFEIKKQNLSLMPFIPTKTYLSFLGGKSLDLNHVYNTFLSEEYPPEIQQLVEDELKNSNLSQKTLYDIHNKKYSKILDYYSLEDLKENFPEFKNVLKSTQVEVNPDSFIGKYQNNELSLFTQDEDLSLQLIKLYWGQGYSLNDLSKYIQENMPNETSNLYHTFKKLNIPTMTKRYGQVLKLSNRKYNEAFSEQMSIKRKEAQEERRQKADGEPVVIPRGPLSEAHKKHISEALKEYYKNSPERIYELTQRQKEYYKEHPEQIEILTEALEYAWNSTQEGRSIKKHLSKALKKVGQISDKELELKQEMKPEVKEAFSRFMQQPWVKTSWSKAMKDGWQWAQVDLLQAYADSDNHINSVRILPQAVIDEIKEECIKRNTNTKYLDFFGKISISTRELTPLEKKKHEKMLRSFNSILVSYENNHPQNSDFICSAKQLAIMKFKMDIDENAPDLPKFLQENPHLGFIMSKYIDSISINRLYTKTASNNMSFKGTDSDTVDDILTKLYAMFQINNNRETIEYFEKLIDKYYTAAKNNDSSALREVVKFI